MKIFNVVILTGGLLAACSVPKEKATAEKESEIVPAIEVAANPPADGFNVNGSDPVAVILADQVMEAMGGRENWNNTRYIGWNFFGSRKHLWDKWTGDIRIESLRSDFKVMMNLRNMEGQVWKDGQLLERPDSVSKYLEIGKSMWINDSYWLVMPFKLKDSGVTLRHVGEGTTETGIESEVISLTFENVGRTPENKYEVWVDRESKLVRQWAFYRNASDTVAGFVRPWGNYLKYNNILLSDDRGDRDLSDIQVLNQIPEGVFSDFEVSLP